MNKNEFEKIAKQYIDILYNRALQLTREPNEAEDLVQETFLKAFRFFFRFRAGNIKAWLFKIMQNIFINNYRKKKKEPEILELNEDIYQIPDYASLNSILLEKDVGFEIQQALDSIPEEFKNSVILSDIEEFSYKEISKIMRCPIGTVRSRIARGREMLFKKLSEYAKSKGYGISNKII